MATQIKTRLDCRASKRPPVVIATLRKRQLLSSSQGEANRRLNTAYVLKESFGQLWDYRTEAGARRFFDNWRDALKWQRLGPFEKFVALVDKHWDGIASFCRPVNKAVPLGYVEGFNNKIRALQRRAYGYYDEDYLRLNILTSGLMAI